MRGANAANGTAAGSLTDSERKFVQNAAQGSAEDYQLAKLASDKATDRKVRMFARRMMSDHERLDKALAKLAQEKGISLKNSNPTGTDEYQDLAKESGSNFDKDFIGQMVDDHEDTVKMFEDMANNALSPSVQALTAAFLPCLLGHYDRAKALKNELH